MANIKIFGTIGQEPELRYTASQQPVLSFSVGIYTGGTKEKGYKDSVWAHCQAWDGKALFYAEQIRKGQRVTVEGQPLPPRTYKKDGREVSAGLEIVVNRIAQGDEFRQAEIEPETDEIPY